MNEYSARYSILDREFYIPSFRASWPRSLSATGRAAASGVLAGEEAAEVLAASKQATTRVEITTTTPRDAE